MSIMASSRNAQAACLGPLPASATAGAMCFAPPAAAQAARAVASSLPCRHAQLSPLSFARFNPPCSCTGPAAVQAAWLWRQTGGAAGGDGLHNRRPGDCPACKLHKRNTGHQLHCAWTVLCLSLTFQRATCCPPPVSTGVQVQQLAHATLVARFGAERAGAIEEAVSAATQRSTAQRSGPLIGRAAPCCPMMLWHEGAAWRMPTLPRSIGVTSVWRRAQILLQHSSAQLAYWCCLRRAFPTKDNCLNPCRRGA